MTVSFHGGHSGLYCDHAEGMLEEVILQAIRQGFTHYGLSEHMPRTRLQDLYPEERELQRDSQQLEAMYDEFQKKARRFQIQYQEEIHLLVGMETEVIHAESFNYIKACIQKYQPDYLVGSVHHVHELPIDYGPEHFAKLEAHMGGTEPVFCSYYDQQFELLKRFQPEVIGHFDLIRLYRPHFPLSERVWHKIERNLAYAIEYGALFEVNARAFRKQLAEPYPNRHILQRLQIMGGQITLGDDSHGPNQVGLNYDRLFDFLHDQHISHYYCLERSTNGKLIKKKISLPKEFPFSKGI